jgi:hypothetical protein
MADEVVAPAHVTYWAVSIFNSRTFWLNAAAGTVAMLSATEVITIIPPRFLPLSTALIAALNIMLRLGTVRPVALIAPGATVPVLVPRIDPPAPPVVTD